MRHLGPKGIDRDYACTGAGLEFPLKTCVADFQSGSESPRHMPWQPPPSWTALDGQARVRGGRLPLAALLGARVGGGEEAVVRNARQGARWGGR